MSAQMWLIYLGAFASVLHLGLGNTECVWATGRLSCLKNQTRVINALVTVWDLDSPQNSDMKNPVDPDDKVGVSFVHEESGLFDVSGCASDFDWVPGIPNRPELYITVKHFCNTDDDGEGETKVVMPIFRVFQPNTYDYHIDHPIVLDN